MTTQRGTRTHRRTMATLVAAVLTAVVTMLSALAVPTVAEAAANEVPVCHGQGNGGYRLINVAQEAMPAHVGHGDASPGAAVPDQPNLNFDDSCTPVDTTAPVVSVPGDISAEATSSGGATVSYVASAVDAVDGPVAVECDAPSGSVFPLGEAVVSCEATDNAGNTGTASLTITVVDTTAPVVTVPTTGGLTLSELTFDPSAYGTSAEDTVDGAIVPQCGLESGSVFAVGGVIVTCTATDNAGNTGTASFTIEITILAYQSGIPVSWHAEVSPPTGIG